MSKSKVLVTYVLFVVVLTGTALLHTHDTTSSIPWNQQLIYTDFDTSMNMKSDASFSHRFDLFRSHYQNNNFLTRHPQTQLKIPKIIHYVWLGKKLPKQFMPLLEHWKQLHPDWIFVHWVDNPENYDLGEPLPGYTFDDLARDLLNKTLPGKHVVMDVKTLDFENRTYFDAAPNYGEKADILRYEVVYRFGGLYIDVDMECLKPFDIVHYLCDFYACIEPLLHCRSFKCIIIGQAIFAAAPQHPIIKHCRETIQLYADYKNTFAKTGPLHFTKSCIAEAFTNNKLTNLLLPASYLYPINFNERSSQASWVIPSESLAIHHWSGSWRD